MKVLFITNVPSPYRTQFFNELGKYCELTVLYERSRSPIRDKRWVGEASESYTAVLMKRIAFKADKEICPEIFKHLKKGMYDKTVICGISAPTELMALELCRVRGIEYCMESDGAFVKDRRSFKDRIKRNIIKHLSARAERYFATGEAHIDALVSDGVKKEMIRVYPFSSVRERDILDKAVIPEEKRERKRSLGMGEGTMILAIGQFVHRKGFDVLLKASRELPESACVCIVGGVPTEEYKELVKSLGLKNVIFAGFKTKDELREYYLAADIFVLPTREDIWGLVVNEAMAAGLPVITTDRCGAGLEMVRDGETGYIVKTDDSEALSKALLKLTDDEALRREMGEKALKKAREYTIETMAQRHIELFNE